MDAFALSPEIIALREAAARFGHERLAPSVREFEQQRSWPSDVRDIVAGFVTDTSWLALVVVLETLAMADAGGLLALDAEAESGWVSSSVRVEWAPGPPAPARVWVTDDNDDRDNDNLVLLDTSSVDWAPVDALAFHASGGVSADLSAAPVVRRSATAAEKRGRSRLRCAAIAVGIAQAALDATLDYTTERVVFGKPVAHHQGNAFALAGLATDVHGARLAVRDAAATIDDGDPIEAAFWATQGYLTAVDTAIAVTDAGIQLLGGHGFLVDHLAEKRFREARMLGLLFGGRDLAEADVAGLVLDIADPLGSAGS